MTSWANLQRRQAGLPPETELVEGVPSTLYTPLHSWVKESLLPVKTSFWDQAQLMTGTNRYATSGDELLTVADFVLFWYPRAQPNDHEAWSKPVDWATRISELDQMLTLGRSVWRVNARGDGLERRTEQSVTTAARQTFATAPPVAKDHLQVAWAAVYGRNPNPDLAYTEAIRAVEDILCPLVEPKKAAKGGSTLGTVIGELKNSAHKWVLALPDKGGNPHDITPLIAMLELLWRSHVSRHGGAPKSRRQDPAEAQAIIHLAVTLTQWLSINLLRLK